MSKPNSPSAFPVVTKAGIVISGMTLRDWFAGQALVTMERPSQEGYLGVEDLVTECYRIADAMLEERESDRKGEKDEW